MSEKIIINEVDVSECLELDHDMATCKLATMRNGFPIQCSICHFCYFKGMKNEQNRRIELEMTQEEFEKKLEDLKEELRAVYSMKHSLAPEIYPPKTTFTFMGKSPEYWLSLQHEHESLAKSYLNFQEVLGEKLDSMNRKIQEVLNV